MEEGNVVSLQVIKAQKLKFIAVHYSSSGG